MDEAPLEAVERELDRAADLEAEAATDVLEAAERRLEELADDPDVDEESRRALEDRIEQRRREVTERDAYDAGVDAGAAMNPEDDEAP